MTNKKRLLILTFLISIILVLILITRINISDVVSTLLSIPVEFIIVSFLIYVGTYIVRSYRFCLVLNEKKVMTSMLSIVCIHNFLNYILPARTGELSFVYLIKKYLQKQYADGITTLIFVRFLDAVLATIIFIISFLLINKNSADLILFLYAGIFCLLLVLVFFLGVLHGMHNVLWEKTKSHFAHSQYHSNKYILKVCLLGDELLESSQKFIEMPRKKVLMILSSSVLIWVFTSFFYYFIAKGMGIDLALPDIIFASSFISFLTLLPIQGFAGFGTIESGWTIGFMLVGVSQEQAITTGFTFHIILLAYISILFILGLVLGYFSHIIHLHADDGN